LTPLSTGYALLVLAPGCDRPPVWPSLPFPLFWTFSIRISFPLFLHPPFKTGAGSSGVPEATTPPLSSAHRPSPGFLSNASGVFVAAVSFSVYPRPVRRPCFRQLQKFYRAAFFSPPPSPLFLACRPIPVPPRPRVAPPELGTRFCRCVRILIFFSCAAPFCFSKMNCKERVCSHPCPVSNFFPSAPGPCHLVPVPFPDPLLLPYAAPNAVVNIHFSLGWHCFVRPTLHLLHDKLLNTSGFVGPVYRPSNNINRHLLIFFSPTASSMVERRMVFHKYPGLLSPLRRIIRPPRPSHPQALELAAIAL